MKKVLTIIFRILMVLCLIFPIVFVCYEIFSKDLEALVGLILFFICSIFSFVIGLTISIVFLVKDIKRLRFARSDENVENLGNKKYVFWLIFDIIALVIFLAFLVNVIILLCL